MHDKFALWSPETTLRGANLYYRAWVEPFNGGLGSPFVPNYDDDIFTTLRAAGANLVVLSIPGPWSVPQLPVWSYPGRS
jgi:hypothetical protein